jgi:hypothetical protein
VVSYQVKYDTVPIVRYEDFDMTTDYIYPAVGVRKSPWWYANNVTGESAPVSPGSGILHLIPGNFSKSDTLYFAVRSRDTYGNLSPLSNVFKLTGDMVGVEQGLEKAAAFSLSAFPNPANPAVVLRFRVPRRAKARLLIYNAAGRLVRDLSRQMADKTAGSIVWNGRSVSSGIYIARLSCEGMVMHRKIALVK